MEIKISKEDFSKNNFEPKKYLNEMLNSGKLISNPDLLSFKLKIIEREINSDIDLFSNNVLKSEISLPNDLKIINTLHNTINTKINNIYIDKTKIKNNNNENKKKSENEFNIKEIEKNIRDVDILNKAIDILK